MAADSLFVYLIAWRVITAFEDRGDLTANDIAALRELVTQHLLAAGGAR